MIDTELHDLIMDLKNGTPLVRLNDTEAKTVFAKIEELGYTITKPKAVK
jgi:hypothetical protein